MKTVKILFEVSEQGTIVVALGSNGQTMSRYDISGSEQEKQFQSLLKSLSTLTPERGKKIGTQ